MLENLVLAGISILKMYWGMDIGSKMIEYLLAWAKEKGVIRKVNLKVRSDNIRAIDLYRKSGFKEEGILTREFLIKGEFFNAIVMGKCIDP